jgi:hemin uptake protein HemP
MTLGSETQGANGQPGERPQNGGDRESAARPEPLRSADLLYGRRAVNIVHAGEMYSLRVTCNNKLILTK